MIIKLMEQHEYDALLEIQKTMPNLTFKHEPYQEWIPAHFTEEDKKALADVKAILSKVIKGFKNFTNFWYNEKGDLCIRVYYDWSWRMDEETSHIYQDGISYTGVGYLKAIELLNGFDKDKLE